MSTAPVASHPVAHLDEDRLVADAVGGDDQAFAALVDRHRHALHAHCRRVLRSTADADDAVQEALLRAWRRRAAFEGRSSFGWWLRCIATNACLDVVARARRAPVVASGRRRDGGASGSDLGSGTGGETGTAVDDDPAELVAEREAVASACLTALRVLPARQRAVLVLRDVLRYSAAETAGVLGDTIPSVNSALQRARSTLGEQRRLPVAAVGRPATPTEHDLVLRLVDALRRADADDLVALCRAA